MAIILSFFIAHWFLSAFAQSFFLHRYAAHAMFKMNKFWEKFFYIFTCVAQGSSFLNPRAYAIMHRQHHAYSDTGKDPHSPVASKGFLDMMWKTALNYEAILEETANVEKEFKGNYPQWPTVDALSNSWTFRLAFGTLYTLFYLYFVPAGQYGWYLLLPVHWLMGPIHGAIVNWCGHMYGYRNHKENSDNSKNTLFVDFLIGGELYQNNHHAHPNSPNFAFRWFELDITYQVMKVLHLLRIIKIQRAVWTEKGKKVLRGSDVIVEPTSTSTVAA
ncbi:acyl-CoA desaturase [Leptospira kmetyi]|uniref:Acyl-CoA desaturase n=1 Tax=Leptospira kmetyi TaxID=408139 RepID=A0A2M9XQY0_9LEPT|nr:acyl-CoA desaturase [Leptospira kmetyi]AYV57801.1 acyl-CoA desaturase [Leptospira kmetyi]EQA55655.1 stearoyl-CoA 9-desaturase [Leptospira kmetyi serovar Malaysia str. Bejo-Iso9]PJZ30354.1 acyl-CoA desaturase [Leptospira kmetyi]PJZ41593.1 acyl-CoA desaturase [Leptospira kmetyi]TGK15072.1 acyl-CoA desaturase [Leptospira kmetyi]